MWWNKEKFVPRVGSDPAKQWEVLAVSDNADVKGKVKVK